MGDNSIRSRGWLWPIIRFVATATTWVAIIIIVVFGWYALDLPDAEKALKGSRSPTITLLSSSGNVFATRGHIYGVPFQANELPKTLAQAVIATEDRRFYSHFGLDPVGIARAAWANIRAGYIVQGGSTLTQQAAKNLFLTPERSFKRKIQEVLLALWLERKFSKNQILTIYLNRVYLGAGTYGVDAAARKYFGKSAKRLMLYESALLAGLLKAPSRYNPQSNPTAAWRRAHQVLKNMVAAGYLSQKQVAKALKKRGPRFRPPLTGGRFFADWILSQLGDHVYIGNRDLTVTTTLRIASQRSAERHVAAGIARFGEKGSAQQGALIAIDGNGAVRALVGGRAHSESSFNRATQATRQPGSAFKPFVYLTALEAGMTPKSQVTDAPININGWKPRNFDGKYQGIIPMGHALAHSVNSAAVRIAQSVGIKRIVDTASRLGIPGHINLHPSLALGTHDVRLIDLTAAYTVFANGGYAIWPYGITEIRDRNGTILFQRQSSKLQKIVAPEHVSAMNSMLAGVLNHGTGRAAKLKRPAAGKTGTSQNYRDAWFIGYTSDLVAGVWIGNDDGAPMKQVTGGGLPARIWKNFMADAHRGLAAHNLPGVDRRPGPPKNNISATSKPLKSNFMDEVLSFFLGRKNH